MEKIMYGKIKFEEFCGLTKMPQKAASAFDTLSDLTGAAYNPLVYVGIQLVNGTNHWFIAEQTLITNPPVKRIVKLAINENMGAYKLVPESIEEIF